MTCPNCDAKDSIITIMAPSTMCKILLDPGLERGDKRVEHIIQNVFDFAELKVRICCMCAVIVEEL